MRLFSLSTAEQGASMALFQGRELICESFWTGAKSHSKRLMAMVEQMVKDRAGLDISDIDGFIAARGPGSFTGLRIGISVIKGLAAAVSKPCAGVSSLDGIAWRFYPASAPVCVMMDAKRQEVYTALYRFERGRLVEKSQERVCPPDEAIDAAGEAALFAGSGSKAYAELIKERAGSSAWISPMHMDAVSAAAMAGPALGNPGFFTAEENCLVPVYLRKSDAEIHFSQKSVS
ncbi:MAG: tRNA (adenosine(37)-N6)-threonylcarbamoyltransferase complex dimerization subunit type 1 TsaB [Desulfobacter sp.]|nr:MAG: tRNA (adenosine(37)-N6)-threonylcarbamoyltransferase complex dimerization subunit type 1 TsaB [Desulfobacter sp.]